MKTTAWYFAFAAALAGCQANAVSRKTGEIARRPDLPVPINAAAVDLKDKPEQRASRPSAKDELRLASAAEEEEEREAEPGAIRPVSGPAVLDLDTAIETGLAQNPDLMTQRQNEAVSSAALGVAQTYPFNPFLQIRATPLQHNTQGGSGSMYHYVLLGYTLQLAHQQQFREEMAASQLNQVRWTIHNFELLNMAQTTRLYFTAIYQRGIRDLARASADLNQQLLAVSETQFDAGQISSADLAIVRIDTRSTSQQAELAEANYQTALLDLKRQLNLTPDTPIELRGDLLEFQWMSAEDAARAHVTTGAESAAWDLPRDRELIRRLADGRPDVMAARADIDTAGANLRLANAARTPDLIIGPYYQNDDFGTKYYGFQTHMLLPQFDNGKPLVRQREAERQQRSMLAENLQQRAEVEAEAAADRYERARKLVEAARPQQLEDLPAELQALEQQFKANEIDVLRIFQGRTSLIQNRRAMLDLLNELSQATAALTAASGVPPRSLVTTGQPH